MRRRRAASALLIAILMVLAGSPAYAQGGGPVYIVEPGDTLTEIAWRFGTTVEALIEVNQLDTASFLQPGQRLIIPGFEGITGVLSTQEIGYGQTLTSLSLQNGVDPQALIRLNRLVNPSRLYAGEPVIIPQDEARPLRMESGTTIVADGDHTLLELAVTHRVDPWLLLSQNRINGRLWFLPGTPLTLPGGDSAPSGLPDPVRSVTVSPVPAVQGRTMEIELDLTAPSWIEGQLGDRSLHFHAADGQHHVALQGIYALAEPGLYDLELRFYRSEGAELLFAFSQPIPVVEGGYLSDPPLVVPPETIDPAVTGPEDALIGSIVSRSSSDRLWEGTFQFPSLITDVFPSRFGSRRSYNNSGYVYFHTGLDFYGGSGTAILAPAPGRVVFAGPLSVRGNTTILDHGWGVFTGYLHQSEISVSVGDLVEPGQTIGLVGATGRVTGAHLHWEVWVGGVSVDPLEWTTAVFP